MVQCCHNYTVLPHLCMQATEVDLFETKLEKRKNTVATHHLGVEPRLLAHWILARSRCQFKLLAPVIECI